MSKSVMVYATKFKLLIPISQKEGTYRDTGKEHEREEIGKKIITRAYVEERNAGSHHERWVIDETETERLFGEGGVQSQVLAKQALDKQSASMNMGDLVAAFRGDKPAADNTELNALKAELAELKKAKKADKKADKIPADDVQPESNEPCIEWGLEKLQSYCKDNGIEFHHLTKEKGLIQLINEAK